MVDGFLCLERYESTPSTFANRDANAKPETKARLYVALVLGVLLHGCESWFLREKEFENMQRLHHDCVRTLDASLVLLATSV